jgi:hypothetical protein
MKPDSAGNRRFAAVLAWIALAFFGLGLLLPAGPVGGGAGSHEMTGCQFLGHVAIATFPLGLFLALLAPVGIDALRLRSRRAVAATGTALLLLAILGPFVTANGRPGQAHLAWFTAAMLLAGATILVCAGERAWPRPRAETAAATGHGTDSISL